MCLKGWVARANAIKATMDEMEDPETMPEKLSNTMLHYQNCPYPKYECNCAVLEGDDWDLATYCVEAINDP